MDNPNYDIKAIGIAAVANNIKMEIESLELENVLKNNPFHECFDNFLIKEDPKEKCYKFESFFSKIIEAIPENLILPKPMVSLIIRYIRQNSTHPKLTAETATLLKNYFMSVLKAEKTKTPIISVNNNMFKSMLKLSQIFAKFRDSPEVDVQDYRMMESVFQAMLYPSTESLIAKKNKKIIDRSDISNLSLAKQTKVFLEVLNEELQGKDSNYRFPLSHLKEIAKAMNMNVQKCGGFYEYMEYLCNQGHMLKKPGKLYEVMTKFGF